MMGVVSYLCVQKKWGFHYLQGTNKTGQAIAHCVANLAYFIVCHDVCCTYLRDNACIARVFLTKLLEFLMLLFIYFYIFIIFQYQLSPLSDSINGSGQFQRIGSWHSQENTLKSAWLLHTAKFQTPMKPLPNDCTACWMHSYLLLKH